MPIASRCDVSLVLDGEQLPGSPAELLGLGVAGVCRYVANGEPKGLTPAELAHIEVAKLPLALIKETDGKSWTRGYAGGLAEGQQFRADANALGFGPAQSCYYALADEAVLPIGANLALAAQCQLGFNTALGLEADAYAEGAILNYLTAKGLIRRRWTPNATSWPGYTAGFSTLLQETAHSFSPPLSPALYDQSLILEADWGQGGTVTTFTYCEIVETPTGLGYWIARDDGAVFSFGDAKYHGGAGLHAPSNPAPLNAPITSMRRNADGSGYWLLGADGGVFALGAAKYYGNAIGNT